MEEDEGEESVLGVSGCVWVLVGEEVEVEGDEEEEEEEDSVVGGVRMEGSEKCS